MVTNKVPRFHVYGGSDVENLALKRILGLKVVGETKEFFLAGFSK